MTRCTVMSGPTGVIAIGSGDDCNARAMDEGTSAVVVPSLGAPRGSPGASNPQPATPVTVRVAAASGDGGRVRVLPAGGEQARELENGVCDVHFDAGAPLEVRFGVDQVWDSCGRDLPVPPGGFGRGRVVAIEDVSAKVGGLERTAAFSRVLFKRQRVVSRRKAALGRQKVVEKVAMVEGAKEVVVVFGVVACRVMQPHSVYAVLQDGVGTETTMVPLVDAAAPVWTACISICRERLASGLRYRFVIVDQGGQVVTGEDGDGRVLKLGSALLDYVRCTPRGTAAVVLAYVNSSFRYNRRWRASGVAVPVFSIRSRHSCGVGEFRDLHRLVDWCVSTGLHLLQLLPVNDTSSYGDSRDTYPYAAVSCFALHPQYLRIDEMGEMPEDVEAELIEQRERLNALDEIDYVGVMAVKNRLTRRMYMEHKERFLVSPEFVEWFAAEQQWLVPYALFRFFMDVNGTPEYDKWGARQSMTPNEMERLASPDAFHFDYLGATYYTQFHLHRQLSAASRYAASHRVVLKGDLPIGVNRYCADTWLHPQLFRLHMQAGAPPDYFSRDGQNWRFPTYNWDAMKAEGYAWWRSRLSHMSRYFHAYRIDHVFGFFRIWEIPVGFHTGVSGRFHPARTLTRTQLEHEGLWDIERFCSPYVRDALLREALGERWMSVRERFFEPRWHDRLAFKPAYDNEVKLEAALRMPEDAPASEREFAKRVKRVLVDMLNNVCLLRDSEHTDSFHPRFLLKTTSSFRELPSEEWRSILLRIHEEYYGGARQEELWRTSASEKLPALAAASDMLMCAEDVGFAPKFVPHVLRDVGILSLAIQRMPPGDLQFYDLATYSHAVVAATSSHDIASLRAWWKYELDEGSRARYWRDILKRDDDPPAECDCEVILEAEFGSQAMWVVPPLQDYLGIDESLRIEDPRRERINNPGDPMHVWNYRVHLDLDRLLEATEFVGRIRQMNYKHKRGIAY